MTYAPSLQNCAAWRNLLGALAVFIACAVAAPAPAETATEKSCYNAVQGKVAWDTKGSKGWAADNVRRLCKGVVDYDYRIACFKSQISGGEGWSDAIEGCKNVGLTNQEKACYGAVQGKVAWNTKGSKDWGADYARNLCSGVVDYQSRISCFKSAISSGKGWRDATNTCKTVGTTNQETACFDAVQGKVAWDKAGSKSWSPDYVRKLCRGVDDYQSRISCFKNSIGEGKGWSAAIDGCQTVGAEKKAIQITGLVCHQTAEAGQEELYLKVKADGGGETRIPKMSKKVYQGVDPATPPFTFEDETIYRDEYYTQRMNEDDGELETWSVCKNYSAREVSFKAYEKDGTDVFSVDGTSGVRGDDLIGSVVLKPSVVGNGAHSETLKDHGGHYTLVYNVAHSEEDLPPCKADPMNDEWLETIKSNQEVGSGVSKRCVSKCDDATGRGIHRCGLGPNEQCSQLAIMLLGCIGICQAAE